MDPSEDEASSESAEVLSAWVTVVIKLSWGWGGRVAEPEGCWTSMWGGVSWRRYIVTLPTFVEFIM